MTVRVSLQDHTRAPKPPRTAPSPPPSPEPTGPKSPRRPTLFSPPVLPHVRQEVRNPGSGRVRCVFIYPGNVLRHAVANSPRPVLDLVELTSRPVDIICEFGGVGRRKLPAYYYASDKRCPSVCSDGSRPSVSAPRPDVRRRVRAPTPESKSKSAGSAYGHRLSPQTVSPSGVAWARVPSAGHPPPPPTPVGATKRGSLPPGAGASSFVINSRRRSSVPAFYVTDHSSKAALLTSRRESASLSTRRNLRH